MIEKAKAWLSGAVKSLTIWFNGTVLSVAIMLPDLQAVMPQLSQYLPENIYKYIAVASLIGNLLLRVKTNKALVDK